jgi:hypothetical protein
MSNHAKRDVALKNSKVSTSPAVELNAHSQSVPMELPVLMADGGEGGVESNFFEFGKQQPSESLLQQQQDRLSELEHSNVSTDWMDSLLPLPPLDPRADIRANAFAQLVQGWENYMNDDGLIDPFPNFQQPLQMLQGLNLCGHPTIVPRLKGDDVVSTPFAVHPVAPSVLRYTYSSPSHIVGRKSSVFDSSTGFNGSNLNEQFPPPPVALDPFQRSSSTPSAFRQHSSYSAFGTRDRSAFTTTAPRYTDFVPVGRESSCFSTFGPVDFYSMALEDMERTSIEVQDISDGIADATAGEMVKDKVGSKRGAASRAAKFLKDIRVLRRRRKNRGGRENPVRPALDNTFGSKSSDDDMIGTIDQYDARPIDTAVTVFTETLFNPNDTSFLSASSEMSGIVNRAAENNGTTDIEDDVCTIPGMNLSDREDTKEEVSRIEQQYQQLDSDMEEEEAYQRIEMQLQSSSPSLFGMKNRATFINSGNRPGKSNNTITMSSSTTPIQVHVTSAPKPRFAMSMEGIAASPSPTRMEIGDGSSMTPMSHESSPQTTRSASSSGHTTQATLPSSSTGQQSGLSTISETDREVMEANKDAKRRRGLDSIVTKYTKAETDGLSNNSSSSNSTNPHRYFSLASSPDLREGAVVPVERFFTRSPSLDPTGQPTPMSRANTTSTSTGSRSESTTSPTTTVSIPVTHASSSSGSSTEEPPTFVSYIDQEATSKLIAFREEMETSAQHATHKDVEEREASPAAEMMVYNSLAPDELTAPSQLRGSRLGRIRSRQSRPPRVPPKSLQLPTETPPPLESMSPLYHHQLSPPRKIIYLPNSNISRPLVLRSSSDPLPSMWNASVLNVTDMQLQPAVENTIMMKCRTYQERNVEVMDASIHGESVATMNVVTPDKN